MPDAYLSKVANCDIFVLILARDVTKPAESEYRKAHETRKPCLVFFRQGAERSARLEALRQEISGQVKFAEYESAKQLASQVRKAVADEVIRNYRHYHLTSAQVRRIKGPRLRRRVQLEFAKAQGDILKDGRRRLDAKLAELRRQNKMASSFAGNAVCECLAKTVDEVVRARVRVELQALKDAGLPLHRERAQALRGEVVHLARELAVRVPGMWELVPDHLKRDSLGLVTCVRKGASRTIAACFGDIEIELARRQAQPGGPD